MSDAHLALRRPELVGGHLVLDLVNTVAWRLDSDRWVDRISEPGQLHAWLTAAGLPGVPSSRVEEVRVELRDIRSAAYAVLQPLAVSQVPASRDVTAVQARMARAVRESELVSLAPLRWQAQGVAATLRLALWRLFEEEDLSRLRQCDDDGCGWLFLDRTRNRSRRWCSSSDCGNRARARRHYARTHQNGSR